MQGYSSDDALLNYPLQRLAPIFHAADLVWSTGSALTDTAARLARTGHRRGSQYRAAAGWFGLVANNHTADAGRRGFLDTPRTVGGLVMGGGYVADARKPVTQHGIRRFLETRNSPI
jgi:hypothetical protein